MHPLPISAASADINLRYLESMLAYQEMQVAGFVPVSDPSPAELAVAIGQVRVFGPVLLKPL